MAIAKRIVQAHCRRIAIESPAHRGAEIVLLAMQEIMNQSLRIAVADDEADMRDYFQVLLPRLGHSVVAVAQNGRELVEKCRAAEPDLVITDIKMPEIDGI